MAGLTPMFSMRDVERWTERFTNRAEEKMLRALIYTGEYFVKIARENGAYTNITGNLRSSIGYVVVRDGEIVSSDFQNADTGTGGEKGVQNARRLAHELALTHNKGLVLIGLAGMDYAVHVEQIKGKDVISSSEKAAEKMLRGLLKKVE